jgi:tRNA wybutosine-synthesizing protein 4
VGASAFRPSSTEQTFWQNAPSLTEPWECISRYIILFVEPPRKAGFGSVTMKKQQQDKLASMGTNSYSIQSKRSMERLYFANDPPYFNVMCRETKFKRRAPTINKGYWLRTKAIESVVELFLKRPSDAGRVKVVVNLGCGYDVLPWRIKHKFAASEEQFASTLFVDIDYPELLMKKVEYLKDPVFGCKLELSNSGKGSHCTYNGWYAQIGADLANLNELKHGLDHILQTHTTATKLSSYDILFVAEVSTTYMATQSADRLYKFLATYMKESASGLYCIIVVSNSG